MLVILFQFLQAVSPYQNIFDFDSKLCLDLEILLIGQIYSEFLTETTIKPVDQDGLHFSYGKAVQHLYTTVIVLVELHLTAGTSINRE